MEGSDPGRTVLEGGVGKRSERLRFGRTSLSLAAEKSYLVLEELEASGAEADVYVVEEQGSDYRRVLKYYRRGIRPKAEITEMLAGLDKEHVVQVYETGGEGRTQLRDSGVRRARFTWRIWWSRTVCPMPG